MQSDRQRFVGPRPFERGEGSLFFGRAHEAGELAAVIIAHAAVLLYAQSGAGKTSLLNAGLTPLLEAEDIEVLPTARVRGELPDGDDGGAEAIHNVYVFNVLSGWGADDSAAGPIGRLTLAGYLKSRPHQLDADGQPRPRAIIFDQFEEIFTFYPEHAAERRGFFEQVRDALQADRMLRVVFAIREEYLAEFAPYAPLLPEQLRTRVRLERLRAPAALEAVTGPLKESRLSFAPGVAENLVNELLQVNLGDKRQPVRGEYTEPVQLQVVCDGLCRRLPPEVTVIDQMHLRKFGDVNEALGNFYEGCLRETKRATGVRIGRLRKWFRGVLVTPEGTRDAIRMGQAETGGMPNRAVLKLEELHLVRGEERTGRGRWYELTHDRFVAPIQAANENARRLRRLVCGTASAVGVAALVIACVMLSQALKTKKRITAAMARGSELAEGGSFQEALNEFNAVIQLDPRNAKAHIKAAESHAMLGQYEETVTEYHYALEAMPSASLHVDLATYCFSAGQFDKGREEILKALHLEHDSSKAYRALGDLETLAGNYEQAKLHYNTAIKWDSKSPDGYLGLGYVHLNLGNAEAAFETFQRVVETAEGEGLARSHKALGEIFLINGDFDRALVESTRAVLLAPTEPSTRRWVEARARNNLASIYYFKGRYDLAEMEEKRAYKIEKDMSYQVDLAESCANLGYFALRQGKQSEADKWFIEAINIDPNNYHALFAAGILRKANGDLDEARTLWKGALEACKGNDPLERMKQWVYRVALEEPGALEGMREMIGKEHPPLGLLVDAFDQADLLTFFKVDSHDSRAIRQLLADEIETRKEKQFSDLPPWRKKSAQAATSAPP